MCESSWIYIFEILIKTYLQFIIKKQNTHTNKFIHWHTIFASLFLFLISSKKTLQLLWTHISPSYFDTTTTWYTYIGGWSVECRKVGIIRGSHYFKVVTIFSSWYGETTPKGNETSNYCQQCWLFQKKISWCRRIIQNKHYFILWTNVILFLFYERHFDWTYKLDLKQYVYLLFCVKMFSF